MVRLAITKLDKRYKPAKEYEAIECEALGHSIRRHLDSLLSEPLSVVRERERQQQVRACKAVPQLKATTSTTEGD